MKRLRRAATLELMVGGFLGARQICAQAPEGPKLKWTCSIARN